MRASLLLKGGVPLGKRSPSWHGTPLRVATAVGVIPRGAARNQLGIARPGAAPRLRCVTTQASGNFWVGPDGKSREQVVEVNSRFTGPNRIILVRHGESEGNVDETVYQRKPDHAICLTLKGRQQAMDAGQKIKDLIGDDHVYFYVSPYTRAMETCYEIGSVFDEDKVLGVREEPRMREQDFGNFQDNSMEKMKNSRQKFGRFFFRFRDGESAADVYDRVTTFRETLRADIERGRFDQEGVTGCTVVICTHGVTLRVFLMRWFKWTVRQWERIHNLSNCELIVLGRGEGGRYSLVPYHSDEGLTKMGLNSDMLRDQHWASESKSKELNPAWPTSGPSFFRTFRPTPLDTLSMDDDNLM